MASSSELIYVVKFNTKGEPQIKKVTRELDKTGKVVRETNRRVSGYSDTIKKTSRSSKSLSKSTSHAGQSMLGLIQVAQDAPYGIRGVANNLQFLSASMGRTIEDFGGLKGAIKGMGAQLMGPLGLVAGVTLLTTLGPQIIHFFSSFLTGSKNIGKAQHRLKLFNDAIDQTLGKRIDDLNLNQQVQITQKAIDSITGYSDNMKKLNTIITQSAQVQIKNNHALRTSNHLYTAQADALKQQTKIFDQALNSQTIHDEGVLKILRKRRDEAKATLAARKALDELGIVKPIKDTTESIHQEIQKTIQSFHIETPVLNPKTHQDALKKMLQQQTSVIAKQGAARLQSIKDVNKMRIQLAKLAGNRMISLAIQEQQAMKQIRDNNLITEQQRQQQLAMTQKIYSAKRKQVAIQDAQATMNARIIAGRRVVSALQGFDNLIAGHGKKHAKERFEINKAMNIANAIMNTAEGVTKALPNIPLAIATAAMGAAQVATIASTHFQGGGAGTAGSQAVSYRGISAQATTPSHRTTGGARTGNRRAETREIRIIDGFGNIVARGQEEIDRRGGRNYLRTSTSSV